MSARTNTPAGFRYLNMVSGLFVGSLLISNVAAQKLIPVGPFIFTGGILLFPVTYVFGDVLTEVYGYAKTRQVIWTGFATNVLMALFLGLVIALPSAPGWTLQREFAAALGLIPRIVLASVLGYWAGEFANSFVLAKMKVRTDGRHLWARTIGSTAVGQAADTVVFVLVAFLGSMPPAILVRITWSAYLFKVVYEAVATPLTYLVVAWLKRVEEVDVFDRSTNFTPFTVRPE